MATKGMMDMQFVRIPRMTRLLDPREGYAEKTIDSEIRIDPLTGFSGRIAHFSTGPRPKVDLEALERASLVHGCPFCPDLLTQVTPKFPPDIEPMGRFYRGEATVFPNLSPYDAHSAVAVVSRAHLVSSSAFTAQQWEDALAVSIDYFRAVHHAEQHIGYGLIGANYMPMAGASLLHPHMQIYATERPGNWLQGQITASENYYQSYRRIYWDDLLNTEKANQVRYLGATGSVEWMVPFVPMSFIGDVEAIFPGRFTILELTTQDLRGFADGLVRILHYMADTNIYSFNLGFYPGQSADDRTWVHARVSFRGTINPALNTPDVSVIRQLYDEPFTTIYPEDMAQQIRPYFQA